MLKSYFATTDKGPYFNTNQDGYIVNLDHNIFGVIDGFGGTGIGDVVTSRIINAISTMLTKVSSDYDATLKYFYDPRRSTECNFIINELLKTHDAQMVENEKNSIYQRGAANCIFLISSGNRVSIISVGKIYSLLFRNNRLQSITQEDDSPILDKEVNSITNIGSWPKSALGLFSPLQYQIKEVNLYSGDQILIASQGALNYLDYQLVESLLSKESNRDALTSIMKTANDLGNRDNQTSILLRY